MPFAKGLVVAALLSCGLFAGCLDDSDPAQVTAEAGLSGAKRSAHAWNGDAVLVAVMGLELGPDQHADLAEMVEEERAEIAADHDECVQEAQDVEEQQECDSERDERNDELVVFTAVLAAGPGEVGDGRAAVWAYRFTSPDGRLDVVRDSDSTILRLENDDMFNFDLFDEATDHPLGEWTIDSDEAARLARGGDETYQAAAGEADATGISMLVQGKEDENPTWVLIIEADDSGAIVFVDAVTGNVTTLADLLGDLFFAAEFGSDSGQFTPLVGGQQSTTFDIDGERHGELAIHVAVSPNPVSPVAITVTDPSGVETTFGVPASANLASDATIVLESVPSGGYLVQMSAGLATGQQWTVSWCSDGFPADLLAYSFNPACDGLSFESRSTGVQGVSVGPIGQHGALSETISRWLPVPGL